MNYRKHRPWIISAAAIAFCAVSFWYAMPRAKAPAPVNNAPANNRPAANKPADNQPPSMSPAPSSNAANRK